MAKAVFADDFRIVMIGKNLEEKAKLGTFITAKSIVPYGKLSKQSSVFFGQWRRKAVTIYNTTDLFSADETHMKVEVNHLLSVCAPGPNAYLLLVDPSEFTQTDSDKLRSILRGFGDDAQKYSMLILTKDDISWNTPFNALKKDCGQRHLRLDFDKLYGLLQENLLDNIQSMVDDNVGEREIFARQIKQTLIPEHLYDSPTVVLNIVLCGRFGDWKTIASKAILGKKQNPPKSSKCVKNVLYSDGQMLCIIELPALSSLTEEAARQESLHCLSLCGPEGIHTFMLVQPVGPLNLEDKQELDAIRRAFTSKMDIFKMILFTVDSESMALAVGNFIHSSKDLQELCESCNNRHFVFNINHKHQVPDLIRVVKEISENGLISYTKSEDKQQVRPSPLLTYNQEKSINLTPSIEPLRIVLIGKTGSGKSATANTIVGRTEFESKLSQMSVTKLCKKAEGLVEGRPVVIVDTPGLFDTTLSNTQVQEELVKCVSLLAPGPHVFLLVLEIGRFTKEEVETVHLIQRFFGEKSDKYTIVLFTKGDYLEKTTIKDYVAGGQTQGLLEKCGNRYHVFNNIDKTNSKQVHELFTKIDAMVDQNGGGYYTSEIFQEAENAIEKETERILKQKAPEIEMQKQANENWHKKVVKTTKSKVAEIKKTLEEEMLQRGKQVQEKQKKIEMEREKLKKFEEIRKHEEQLLKIQGERQIQTWNDRYKASTIKKDSDSYLRRKSLALGELQSELTAFNRQRGIGSMRVVQKQRREKAMDTFARLESEYATTRATYESKIQEEQIRRKELEQEFIAVEESYLHQMEAIHQRSFEDARRQAVACNDFQTKYTKELTVQELGTQMALVKVQERVDNAVVLRHLQKSKLHLKDYNLMKERQGKEIRELLQQQAMHDPDYVMRGVDALRKRHDEEVQDWIQEKVKEAGNNNACTIL